MKKWQSLIQQKYGLVFGLITRNAEKFLLLLKKHIFWYNLILLFNIIAIEVGTTICCR